MAGIVHWIDPDADTVIILKNANARFAPWDKAEDVPGITASEVNEHIQTDEWATPGTKKKGKKGISSMLDVLGPEPDAPEAPVQEDDDEDWGFFSRASKKKKKAKKGFATFDEEPPPPVEETQPLSELIPEPALDNGDQWGFGKTSRKGKKKKKGKVSTLIDESPPPPHEPEAVVHDEFDGTIPSNLPELSTPIAEFSIQSTSINTQQLDEGPTEVDEFAPTTADPEPVDPEAGGIRFYVSSRHLKLASAYFKRAMTEFSESIPDPIDGLYHVDAKDWDEEAFLLLLNVFHLQHRKVPQTIGLEMLAKIAVLVDYYKCSEALVFFTDMWTKDAKSKIAIPSTYCRDLILWVWVAWVFEIADKFQEATATVITSCDEHEIRSCGLPIPFDIIEDLKHGRYLAIEAIMSGLDEWFEVYRSETYTCSRNTNHSSECGAILLGSLDRQMRKIGLASPRPEIPFAGWSFEYVRSKVRSLESPRWYDTSSRNNGSYYNSYLHNCGFDSSVHSMVDNIAAITTGLPIGRFPRTPTNAGEL